MLAENLLISFTDAAANKHTVVMHCPSLIQRAFIPVDNLTSRPDATVGKMKEAAIVGFKGLHLN